MLADIRAELSGTILMSLEDLQKLVEESEERIKLLKEGRLNEMTELLDFADHFNDYVALVDERQTW